jgi:hypothetical protein
VVSIKIDSKMKNALRKQAENEFSSISSIIKKSIDEYLQKNGIDWRKEKPKK